MINAPNKLLEYHLYQTPFPLRKEGFSYYEHQGKCYAKKFSSATIGKY